MRKSLFLLYLIGCLAITFSSCQHNKEQLDYTQQAYEEQQMDCMEPLSPPPRDEISCEELTLKIESCVEKPEWQRKPYETIDSWLDRIRNILLVNQKRIDELREQKAGLAKEQQQHTGKMNALIERNEQLRQEMSEAIDENAPPEHTITISTPPAPFTVYVVRKGDTLFSIAMKHYGTGTMVRDILLWNQGWIRDPHELVAGMGIVLFTPEAKDTRQQIVEQYLHQVGTSPVSME